MPVQAVVAARPLGWDSGPGSSVSSRIVRSRAPLRLGLAGGGSDVSPFCDRYGGLVLNATIDRYCYATIEETADGSVEFSAADQGLAGPESLPLHLAAYERVCSEFSLGRPGLRLTTVAEAPPGSGLGSSSTMVVAMVEAFREYFSLPLGDYEIARLAYEIERVDAGLLGGRQDQYAATFGGFNSMEFEGGDRVVVQPLRLKAAIVQEFEASLVLYHSGVSRSSAEIIERQRAHVGRDEEDRISATLALKDEAEAMRRALLVGDFHGVAEVIHHGWLAKRRLADGISTPEIERVFDVALDNGAVAGKVSGAGGGGYIMFVVDPLKRPSLLSALSVEGGGGAEPCHFVAEGAVSWRLR